MSDRYSWGIFRERAHSPGRESDDAEILRLTAKELEAKGFQVVLKDPEELSLAIEPPPPLVFLMCERAEVLHRLRDWARRGTCLVNGPVAVLNTYRERMLALWDRARIPFPRSRVVPTEGPHPIAAGPVWVKRADVHNTREGDVVFAGASLALRDALHGLAGRGIPRAVIQEHVEGDLIKFYAIGTGGAVEEGTPWFRWFYPPGQRVVGHRFDPTELAELVRRAALAVGLEVCGGDLLVTSSGVLLLIDLNAWPSLALYREEAARAIASYLEARFLARRRYGRA